MSVFNLGVVFGPTLLRPLEETVAAILDIKFNNIVINILIENYELIFKSAPITSSIMNSNSSPPARIPRSNQLGAKSPSGSSAGRTSMYSPQQQVYRVVAKSNYTEQPMSSSLQNIPNGMIYQPSGGSNGGSGVGVGGGNGGGVVGVHMGTNGGLNTSNGGSKINAPHIVGNVPVKNHHSMSHMTLSESDISMRREPAFASVVPGIGVVGTNGGLSAHHATPANATNIRHDYLMATATPASTGPTNHTYGTNSNSNRVNLNNISPPTLAMRTEAIYGQTGATINSRHMGYAQAKHYPTTPRGGGDSNDRMHASTSSSNESVCDSNSSSRDKSHSYAIANISDNGRMGRPSMDYVGGGIHSQASSLSTLLGSTCDDVVTATAAATTIGGAAPSPAIGSAVTNDHQISDYVPKKIHRTKDVNQIKRDLSAGTA